MNNLLHYLLYSDAGSFLNNCALLGFRVLLSLELFRVHGLGKLQAAELTPNPLHLPPQVNNLVATLADTVVPALVILGVATRLSVLPTLGVTAVGYFVVHRGDSPQVRDVPYMYTLCFLLLLVLGPGTFSVDYYLWSRLQP
jgi:putative oxidoreductase